MAEEKTIQTISLGTMHSFNSDLKPIAWSKIREEIAPQGVKLETNELIDQKFIILRMKRFISRYEKQEYAFFVVGVTTDDGDLFNTVIGGAQPMEVLDAILEAGYQEPIEFVLCFNEGGMHDGYYTLE